MKRKFLIGIYIVLAVIFAKLMFRYVYNEAVISAYESEDYSVEVSALKVLNWYQPYIVHYNDGNIEYQNGNFDTAIEAYSKALALNPPKFKECSVRINVALAMIGRMGEDFDAPENVDDSIAQLQAAKDVLLADECATEYDDGHSETAEKLKEEIEEMLRKLQEQKQLASAPGEEETGPKSEDSEDDEVENSLKQQLRQIQSEAYTQREEQSQFVEDIRSEMNFNFDNDPIW